MAADGSFSWHSELPSGRNPYWIRDEALADLGLHVGDAVSIDTRAQPRDGEYVVVEADLEGDGDSQRLARRLVTTGEGVRLEAAGGGYPPVELPAERVIVLGVIVGRVQFQDGSSRVTEVPLPAAAEGPRQA